MTSIYEIEKCAHPAFAETLAEIGASTFSEAFGRLYKPEDLRVFLKEKHAPSAYRKFLSDPKFGVWIARETSGEAIAYLLAGPCALPVPKMPENSGELMRLYVRRPFQGSGVGGRLLRLALEWLEARFDHVYLGVYARNRDALRLYARHGFEKICEYSYMVGDHADPEFILKRC